MTDLSAILVLLLLFEARGTCGFMQEAQTQKSCPPPRLPLALLSRITLFFEIVKERKKEMKRNEMERNRTAKRLEREKRRKKERKNSWLRVAWVRYMQVPYCTSYKRSYIILAARESFSNMADKFQEFAGRLGKAPRGVGTGFKFLAAAALAAYGIKESIFTGRIEIVF